MNASGVKYCQKHNRKYMSDIGCSLCKGNEARRAKHKALTDLGLKRVRGTLGGTYYE